MRKHLLIIQGLVFGMVSVCHADNIVTKMFPENGATDVNIDTHLILTMAEDATVGQQGFVSVYDRRTGKLVDRLDMSTPAGPTQGQPKNPAAQYTPAPYIYKSQSITNRNTKLVHRLVSMPGIRVVISSTSSVVSLMVSISTPSSLMVSK